MSAVPPFAAPVTAGAWHRRRDQIRATLRRLLGELPPDTHPEVDPEVEIVSRDSQDGFVCERFRFHNADPLGGAASTVPGVLLLPANLAKPAPAIQYLHWHGGEYDLGKEQLWRKTELGISTAEALTRRGFVVLCIDAYGFGGRAGTGPGGPSERGGAEELSLSKLNLWYGRTLWGMMLRDERLALNYLLRRPEVDSGRVAAMGMSMGSTRAWWHMALDERVRVAVAVACLTRYEELIEHRALKAHGIYYFVPGMLRHFDTEAVIACCAPRPLLCLTGDQDGGSPADGVRRIEAAVAPVYRLLNAETSFRSVLYPGVGHDWTQTMWDEAFRWLERV